MIITKIHEILEEFMKKLVSLLIAIMVIVSPFGTMTIVNADEVKGFTDIIGHWA